MYALADLDPLPQPVGFRLRPLQAGGHKSPLDEPAQIPVGTSVTFAGTSDAPASAIFAVVDGHFVRGSFAAGHFTIDVPATALSRGHHRVAFELVAADLSGYYKPGRHVDIDVR